MNEFKDFLRKKSWINLSLVFTLGIQGLICIFGSSSSIIDVISLALYFGLLIVIYFNEPEMFLKYLWFIVVSTWGVVAVFLLENGNVFLRGNTSYHFGSMPIYVLSWLAFYAIISVLENIRKRRLIRKIEKVNYEDRKPTAGEIQTLKVISMIGIVLLVACFLSVINKPYFIYSIDRFQYSQTMLPPIVAIFMPIFYAFMPIPIMLRKEKKWIPRLYCGLLFILSIWCGEKFTGLLVILYFMFLSLNPAFVGEVISKKIKKIIVFVVALVTSMLVVVYIQQAVLGQQDFRRYLEDRIAAQGELWWLTYATDNDSGTHFDEILDEVDILIHQPEGTMSDYDFGIYKMMKRFMNPDWVKYALSAGVRATESTRATFFYYGKSIGLITGQLFLGAWIFLIVNRCIDSCNRRNWLQAVPIMYIMRLSITAAIMSDFQLLTQKKVIFLYLFIMIIHNKKIAFKRRIS